MIALVITLAVALLALAAGIALAPQVKSRRLRGRFGAEYERVLLRLGGDVGRTEQELTDRLALRRELRLTAVGDAEREQALLELRRLQELFVDDPVRATGDADRLLQTLLERIGYPVKGRLDVASVDHAAAVDRYRAARQSLDRARAGTPETEELRTDLLAIRGLAVDLLRRDDDHPAAQGAAPSRTSMPPV